MTRSTVTPTMARRAWRALEAVHGMIYFTPHAAPAYAAVGVDHHRAAYFGSRAAAMGAVTPAVVVATFYNFAPDLVHRSMDGLWQRTTPQQMLEARLAAVHASLRQAWDADILGSNDLRHAAAVARVAALAACDHCEGRPLFAAHAALDWPDEAHLVLWHAQTLLREYRGDGHIAALVIDGLSGIEALVSHAASGDVPAAALMATRAWTQAAWDAAVGGLAERGLVDASGAFTPAGAEQRARIEAATDAASVAAYAAIGERGCDDLRRIGRTLSAAVVAAGLLTPRLGDLN